MHLKILTALTLGISTFTLNAESPISCPVVTVGDVAKVFNAEIKNQSSLGNILIEIDGKKYIASVFYMQKGSAHEDDLFTCVKHIHWKSDPTTCYYHVYNKVNENGSCESGDNDANLVAYFWMSPMQNLK